MTPNQASTGGLVLREPLAAVNWNVASRRAGRCRWPKSSRRAIRRSTTDCQAHAATLRLRRKECIEYLIGVAQGQPTLCHEEIWIWPSSPNCDFIESTPPVSFIASTTLSMRFICDGARRLTHEKPSAWPSNC